MDTDGLLLVPYVREAGVADPAAGEDVLVDAKRAFPRLELAWADAAYQGLVDWAQETLDLLIELVPTVHEPGFHVAPRRWVVERTFAWLGKCRRLSQDYERSEESAEAWIYLAMTRLMVRRLAATAI